MEAQKLDDEQITEEQRRRAEANRLAALAKRKARLSNQEDDPTGNQLPWKLFKCRKISSNDTPKPILPSHILPVANVDYTPKLEITPPLSQNFRAKFEICSPDSFSVTPQPLPGFLFPGEEACFEKLAEWLSDVGPSHYTQNVGGGQGCVYKLSDYDMILKCLKNRGIGYEEIPWGTFNVVEKMSHAYAARKWIPCRPEHLPDEKVDELMSNLPKVLLRALLPFQLEGVRFGVRRGGRCLIADEMGLGKTLQAIAIAGCFMNAGPILIVCPAILRFSWAEELERWFPYCLPSDIHLVFCHQDNPVHLTKIPRIVVISYKMLHHLRRSMLEREWGTLIIDESHHLRCTKKTSEPKEIKYLLNLAVKVKHLILLSGTPSLSRPFDIFHQINMLWPGLLGKTKYEFASMYCSVQHIWGCQGKDFQDFSRGVRLEELNVLLQQTVMIRRLKQHVMAQLPPIRRQIIRLVLKKSDIALAKAVLEETAVCGSENNDGEVESSKAQDKNGDGNSSKKHGDQVIGIAKLPGFLEWLSLHPIIAELECDEASSACLSSQKMIIFGHHHKVLDRVQAFISEKGMKYIRIDSNVSAHDRKEAVKEFQSSKEVKVAIMGIDSGGVGLNLTAAQNVVFLELPKDISRLGQAESRAHRFGQTEAVNVYIFCAKDTSDESRWQNLNRSLFRVTTTVDGKYDAKHEIKVDTVSYFETGGRTDEKQNEFVLEGKTEVSAEILRTTSIESPSPDTGYHEETSATSSKVQSSNYEPVTSGPDLERSSPKATCEVVAKCSSYITRNHGHKNQQEMLLVNIVKEARSRNCGVLGPEEVAARSFCQVNSLRFEVSLYTGRIHLYSCVPGLDSRPQPLFRSFRMEEMGFEDGLEEGDFQKAKCPADAANYQNAVMIFTKQWKQLRPIDKRKLMLKPLRVPLSIELCCLDEALNHSKGGLLKTGSKRRSTPINEISHPLPSGASWKEVHLYTGRGKKEKVYKQGWSAMDEPLCKLCQTPCKNENAKKPVYLEELFCKLECYEEYCFRTSNRCLREALFEIERGICTNCQLDCHKLVKHLRPLSCEMRQEYIKKVAPKLATRKKLFDKLVQDPAEGNAWHADHLVPVYQGGGECRLENMRTLCVACHADVTAAQCTDRRLARANARKQLKAIMNLLNDAETPTENGHSRKDHQQDAIEENMAEKGFLIEVPGSAYSRTAAINPGS